MTLTGLCCFVHQNNIFLWSNLKYMLCVVQKNLLKWVFVDVASYVACCWSHQKLAIFCCAGSSIRIWCVFFCSVDTAKTSVRITTPQKLNMWIGKEGTVISSSHLHRTPTWVTEHSYLSPGRVHSPSLITGGSNPAKQYLKSELKERRFAGLVSGRVQILKAFSLARNPILFVVIM